MLGFLLLPLYTKWLGTAGFGESDLITTYSSFLVSIMTMCVADGIFVFTKNKKDSQKKVYFTSTIVFILGVLIVWFFVWLLAGNFFEKQNYSNSFTDNLWLIYGIVITTFFQQYFQQFLLSIDKIRVFSFTGVVYTILTLLFSYKLIPSLGVRGYILSIIFANLLTSLYSFVFSKSYCFFSITYFKINSVCEVLKYSIPLIPNSVMWWLVSALNRPVMEQNLDYSSIGIFAVANRFPAVITMIYSIFSVAWNISVFEEYGKKEYGAFYKKTFCSFFLLITIFTSIFITLSRQVISFFAAAEFYDAWKYMIILIIGSFITCISGFVGSNFSVVKKSRYFLLSSVWGAVSSVVLNILLIPRYGLWGASFSVFVSFFIMMISRCYYSRKIVKENLNPSIIKYLLTLVAISLSSYFISSLFLRLMILLGVLFLLIISEKNILKSMMFSIYK